MKIGNYVHTVLTIFRQMTPFFYPHFGDCYGKPNSIFGKRLMILGDSHYCRNSATCNVCGNAEAMPQCTSFTEWTVETYLDENEKFEWKKTYSTFINGIFGRKTTISERKQFFDSVVFANFLQVAAGSTPYDKSRGTYDHEAHIQAFYSCLERAAPDVVICWGDDVWEAIPNDWGYGEANKESLLIGDESFHKCYNYPFRDTRITLIGAHHPSMGFQSQLHHLIFEAVGVTPKA